MPSFIRNSDYILSLLIVIEWSMFLLNADMHVNANSVSTWICYSRELFIFHILDVTCIHIYTGLWSFMTVNPRHAYCVTACCTQSTHGSDWLRFVIVLHYVSDVVSKLVTQCESKCFYGDFHRNLEIFMLSPKPKTSLSAILQY